MVGASSTFLRTRSLWEWGGLVRFYALGEDTGGAFTLLEEDTSPQGGAFPHVHHEEDQTLMGRPRVPTIPLGRALRCFWGPPLGSRGPRQSGFARSAGGRGGEPGGHEEPDAQVPKSQDDQREQAPA